MADGGEDKGIWHVTESCSLTSTGLSNDFYVVVQFYEGKIEGYKKDIETLCRGCFQGEREMKYSCRTSFIFATKLFSYFSLPFSPCVCATNKKETFCWKSVGKNLFRMKCETALKGFSFCCCVALPDGNLITFIKITSIINALIQCRQRRRLAAIPSCQHISSASCLWGPLLYE